MITSSIAGHRMAIGIGAVLALSAASAVVAQTPEPYYQDAHTLVNERNFLTDYQPTNTDGSVNVVVEIPTGTLQLWQVERKSGSIVWSQAKGREQSIHYLGYPGNYGFVPRTVLSEESGGDGEPLDAIVLSPAVQRGDVVKARVIGVLKLLDQGLQDHKLIAVVENTALYSVNDITELQQQFPGIDTILLTWFANYLGPGRVEIQGFGDAAEAGALLTSSAAAFQ